MKFLFDFRKKPPASKYICQVEYRTDLKWQLFVKNNIKECLS